MLTRTKCEERQKVVMNEYVILVTQDFAGGTDTKLKRQ